MDLFIIAFSFPKLPQIIAITPKDLTTAHPKWALFSHFSGYFCFQLLFV